MMLMMMMMMTMIFEARGASFCSENAFRLTKLSDCRSHIDDQLKGGTSASVLGLCKNVS